MNSLSISSKAKDLLNIINKIHTDKDIFVIELIEEMFKELKEK